MNVTVFNSISCSQLAEAADVRFAALHRQPQQIGIVSLSYLQRSKLSRAPTQAARSNSINISPGGGFLSASFAISLTPSQHCRWKGDLLLGGWGQNYSRSGNIHPHTSPCPFPLLTPYGTGPSTSIQGVSSAVPSFPPADMARSISAPLGATGRCLCLLPPPTYFPLAKALPLLWETIAAWEVSPLFTLVCTLLPFNLFQYFFKWNFTKTTFFFFFMCKDVFSALTARLIVTKKILWLPCTSVMSRFLKYS